MNAWLLTWEGTEAKSLWDDDNKIVTILSGRKSSKSVELIVDVLYTRCIWTASDLSYCANRRKEHKRIISRANGLYSGILCGSNPYIYARQVTDLVVAKDEDQQLEHISWMEPPYWKQDSAGKLIEVERATPRQLTRALEPVSAEVYPRRKRIN